MKVNIFLCLSMYFVSSKTSLLSSLSSSMYCRQLPGVLHHDLPVGEGPGLRLHRQSQVQRVGARDGEEGVWGGGRHLRLYGRVRRWGVGQRPRYSSLLREDEEGLRHGRRPGGSPHTLRQRDGQQVGGDLRGRGEVRGVCGSNQDYWKKNKWTLGCKQFYLRLEGKYAETCICQENL